MNKGFRATQNRVSLIIDCLWQFTPALNPMQMSFFLFFFGLIYVNIWKELIQCAVVRYFVRLELEQCFYIDELHIFLI